MKDLIEQVEALGEIGAGFQSLQESIYTTTPGGRLTFHIFGALAEFERDLTRQRTMAGLRAAEERGRTGGRPRAISESDLPAVQKLMRDPEVPAARIAEMFGCPGGHALPLRLARGRASQVSGLIGAVSASVEAWPIGRCKGSPRKLPARPSASTRATGAPFTTPTRSHSEGTVKELPGGRRLLVRLEKPAEDSPPADGNAETVLREIEPRREGAASPVSNR